MTKASFDFAKRAEEWARKRLSHFGARDDLPISSIEDIAEEAYDAGARDYAEHVAEVVNEVRGILRIISDTRGYGGLTHVIQSVTLATEALALLDSLAGAEGGERG